jgi:hypothetical protein
MQTAPEPLTAAGVSAAAGGSRGSHDLLRESPSTPTVISE